MLTVSVHTQHQPAAYAQQQGKACPPGFQLNKGVCQAEQPMVCPNNLSVSPSGEKCIVGQSSDAVATCPGGYNLQPVLPPGSGTDGSNFKCVPNSGEGEYIDWKYGCREGEELLLNTDPNPTRHFCYVVTDMVPGPCPDGSILNESNGLCEVKPGRR